jgi:hypothetical protein
MSVTGILSPTVSRILPIIGVLLIRSSCAHAWFRTTTVRTPFRNDRGVAFRETSGPATSGHLFRSETRKAT